jgi:hypothetical protein
VVATGAGGTTQGAILSFTVPGPASIQFADPAFAASVTAGAGQLTLTRTGNLPATVTVVVSSPGGPGVAPFQQTITFGPNTPSAVVTVPIGNDGRPGELDVAIPFSLSAPSTGAVLGADVSATLVVHDDNPPPPPVRVTSLTLPTIHVATGKGRKARSKSETVIRLSFSGSLGGAGNGAAYQLLSGRTRKRVTSFNKVVPLSSAVYDPVTLIPARKLKLAQPEQLRVDAALLTGAFGDPIAGGQDFVATFSNRGVTMARARGDSSHSSLAAPAVDVRLGSGSLAPARRIHGHASRKARPND